LIILSGCQPIFETDRDIQARQAMFDLMEIQEKFFKDKQRYARNLVEIESYNLKYHTGLVYLEIENSSKSGYRAISLPAESTTARVFAYDSDKGGFYEMQGEEISKYVLGSLNHIRKKNDDLKLVDSLSWSIAIFLLALGIWTLVKQNGKGKSVLVPYFLCLIPLVWAMVTQNHMNDEIITDTLIVGMWVVSVALAAICITWGTLIISKGNFPKDPPIFMNLLICTMLISFCSGLLLLNSYMEYGF
jgi:uncharacterized membrane protein